MDKICKPALIYLVVAVIMLAVGVILRFESFNLGVTCSQFCSIILCTVVLAGFCSIGTPEISWIITAIFLLCTFSGIVAMIMNLFNPAPTAYNPRVYNA